MIASSMLYGAAIAALLSLAAFLMDRTLGAFKLPRRFVWLTAMIGSLLLPIGMTLNGVETPGRVESTSVLTRTLRNLELQAPVGQPFVAPAADPTSLPRLHVAPSLDLLLGWAWICASLGLGLFYSAAWMRARRAVHEWTTTKMDGQLVSVSERVGPAVLGFVRPRIVVPRWLFETEEAFRALILEHERQHLRARDQLSLLLALCIVVLLPWNVPLWWQLRRLRFAIEVDCDARVLQAGADPIAYGEVLIHVGRRYVHAPTTAVALIEPPSDLERRIRILMSGRTRFAALVAVGCSALCASLVVAATQIDPPQIDRPDLRVLPPRLPTHERVQAIVRQTYPELFAAPSGQPVLVSILLNNDLSVDWSEKKPLPAGTTQEGAEAREQPKMSLAQRLDPNEPRFMGRFLIQDDVAAPPVFVSFAVHVFHRARSAAVVGRALQAKFPELHDDAADADTLLIALMNDDGTVERAIQRPRIPGESLIGGENQLRALAGLNVTAEELSVVAMLPGNKVPPYKPLVLYAYEKSGDPALDADPTRPVDQATMKATQRAIIERHFPEIADGSSNPHALLWVLLDQRGEVVATGREATSPEPLMVNLEKHHPGAATANRLTTQLTALFDRPMRDTEGQPLLVTFVWLDDASARRPRQSPTVENIALDMTIHRNGQLVTSAPLSLEGGVPQTHVTGQLRLDITALHVGTDLVDLGVVMRVPRDGNGVDFAERWEVVSQPMLRAKLGQEATIEQGVRYPGKSEHAIWRVTLVPRLAGT